jgi:hypothetical protein
MSAIDFLGTLTHEEAVQYVGRKFRLVREGSADAELELVGAERLMPNRPRSKRMKRDPFSLYFTGPGDAFLPQGMYNLEGDPSLPSIFLVPIGRNEDGKYEYEAVFT